MVTKCILDLKVFFLGVLFVKYTVLFTIYVFALDTIVAVIAVNTVSAVFTIRAVGTAGTTFTANAAFALYTGIVVFVHRWCIFEGLTIEIEDQIDVFEGEFHLVSPLMILI